MKHLIKIESTPNGVLGVRHAGLDQQYCESGEQVILKWQPDAKWGLQEAHYTDGDGNVTPIDLTPVKVNGKEVVVFIMPNANITVGGTFKRFVVGNWTEGKNPNIGNLFVSGQYGQPITNRAPIPNLGKLDYLPILDEDGEGTIAYYRRIDEYVYWTGSSWVSMVSGNDVTPHYLTFISNQDSSKIVLEENGTPSPISLFYSENDGFSWLPYNIGDELIVDNGKRIMMRGSNKFFSSSSANYYKFNIEGNIKASGDVTSILNDVGGDLELTPFCFYSLFNGCTDLTEAPAFPSTMLAESCYRFIFGGCTGLMEAPVLPATTLAVECYRSMFDSCTGLMEAPVLPATTLASSCYQTMFYGCTNITLHDVATLNNSTSVFQNNSSCASFTIHADTPPTIGNNTITGLKANCIIYVPAASVDAYKAAQYWSARASYIQAIQ